MKKALVLLLIFAAGSVLSAQQRYALVIGNNNYNSVRKLNNPVNDATDIAGKLRNLGYQVDLQTNVTNVAMARSITGFIQRLSQNRDNEGFFWFAGHAVQINNENYLLPIDVNSANEVEAVHSSYAVKRLVDSLDQIARNKVNVVVLDACRDNPFVNMPGSFRNVTRGLSVVQNLPSDLLILYSTAAGAVALDGPGQRNSPFAQAFLQSMESNEDIQIVFRTIARETMRLTNNNQRPFNDGSIISLDFYSLNPRRTESTQSPVQTVIVGNNEDDAVYWINGIRNVLPRTSARRSDFARARDVAISNSNIYIVGIEVNGSYSYAVYWLNGVKNVLPQSGNGADASGIAISGSNIYIVGSDGDDAVYWLNGVRNVLPRSGNGAGTSDIAISGSNVYIVGKDGDNVVYWLNGIKNILPRSTDWARARGIAISGSNIYIVGYDGDDVVYWLNGVKYILPKKNNYGFATSIAISGSNIYIAGYDGADDGSDIGNEAVYWLNGVRNILPTTGPMVLRVASKIIVIQ
jgi:hypothetical protein